METNFAVECNYFASVLEFKIYINNADISAHRCGFD